jgi:hypothetical protein
MTHFEVTQDNVRFFVIRAAAHCHDWAYTARRSRRHEEQYAFIDAFNILHNLAGQLSAEAEVRQQQINVSK